MIPWVGTNLCCSKMWVRNTVRSHRYRLLNMTKNIQWAILPGFLLVKLSLYKYMYARTHVSIFGSLTSLKKFITTGSWVSALFLNFPETWQFLLQYELQWVWAITYKTSFNYYFCLTFFRLFFCFAVLPLQFFDNN